MQFVKINLKSPFTVIHAGQVSVPYGSYSCEYCGSTHKTRCDTCDMPPCRCHC